MPLAQRLGKVFASPTTWARLVRDRGWRRPRTREYPAKPKVGVRATRPNEYWHVDTTILKLLDGTRVYIHGVIDNFSRKILAWTVAARLEPGSTCAVLLAAARHLGPATSPTTLVADSGVENPNAAVDATLFSACLQRVLAQVVVLFSNSMIERFWMSLRHHWLYLHSLDSIARVRSLVDSFVELHNNQDAGRRLLRTNTRRNVLRHRPEPGRRAGCRQEDGPRRASRGEPSGLLQAVRAAHRARDSSVTTRMTQLRTRGFGRSWFAAGPGIS